MTMLTFYIRGIYTLVQKNKQTSHKWYNLCFVVNDILLQQTYDIVRELIIPHSKNEVIWEVFCAFAKFCNFVFRMVLLFQSKQFLIVSYFSFY